MNRRAKHCTCRNSSFSSLRHRRFTSSAEGIVKSSSAESDDSPEEMRGMDCSCIVDEEDAILGFIGEVGLVARFLG